MIIDFHSHIIPAFDDGAADAEMSLKMLQKSRAQGVDTVVSTSHCYPYSNHDVTDFLKGRREGYSVIKSAAQSADIPQIILGSEVHLTCDLTRFRDIKRLCIGETDYMLVEMPVSKWNDTTIDMIYKLSISGIKPIIAHAERNIMQDKELLNNLYMLDVLFQVNAESFVMPVFKKFINNMLRSKLLHIVGTDMHNMTTRAPNMDIAVKSIDKRFGPECRDYLMTNAHTILSGGEISYRDMRAFSKKSLLRR